MWRKSNRDCYKILDNITIQDVKAMCIWKNRIVVGGEGNLLLVWNSEGITDYPMVLQEGW